MPDGLRYEISGILAGGFRGFRIVLCCFAHIDMVLNDKGFLGFLPVFYLFDLPCQHLR